MGARATRPDACGPDVAPSLSGRAPAGFHQATARPRIDGKFLFLGDKKVYVKGVTYGAFQPDSNGDEYHDVEAFNRDFALMAESGMNAVRIPHTTPPRSLLDAAERHGLKVMVGLGAEQYAGYLTDRKGAPDPKRLAAEKLTGVAGHPAILCYALGNEIQASLVRWLGRRTVERYLERLYVAVKDEDPGSLVTYVNYPTTEYLDLPFLDLVAFNVYLERRDRLESYLARLQTLAGDRPLLMSEVGLDALRHGEDRQAEALDWQIRQSFASGCAGAFVFSWTDEWFRAGAFVEDWAFGLTRSDRTPKPALARVSSAFGDAPFVAERTWPRVSVVVCAFNAAGTLATTLEGVDRLEYAALEVIVVDDGSTDDTAVIAEQFDVRLIRTSNDGLGSARNVGAAAATGEIVAYLDADASPDAHWVQYLVDTFERTGSGAVGGPNIPTPGASAVAESVAHSPGGPTHVLLSDTEAEHIPGCNFAIRKDVLEELGGFDPQFRAAGDDVDLCWRLQQAGHRIAFHSGAMVWHLRRSSLRAYWRQQLGYGRAEALLERKWPDRYNSAGHVSWVGHVYGNTFARLLGFRRGRIYGGVWGSAPFQSLYQANPSILDSLARLPEWYLVVGVLACMAAFAPLWSPLILVAPLFVAALLVPLADAVYSGLRTRFGRRPRRELWRLRGLTTVVHLVQPLARLVGRIDYGLAPWRRRGPVALAPPTPREVAVWVEEWRPPDDRVADIAAAARRTGLAVRSGGGYDRWDLEVTAGMLGAARVLLAVEDHGAGSQYVRLRITPRISRVAATIALALLALAAMAAADGAWIAAAVMGIMATGTLGGCALECAAASAATLRGFADVQTPERAALNQVSGDAVADLPGAPVVEPDAQIAP